MDELTSALPGEDGGTGRTGDEAAIRRVAQQFANAVIQEDHDTIIDLLCEEEAQPLIDDPYDVEEGRAVDRGSMTLAVQVYGIRVVGNLASAVVVSESGQTPLYFRREAGRWKVCADAADELP